MTPGCDDDVAGAAEVLDDDDAPLLPAAATDDVMASFAYERLDDVVSMSLALVDRFIASSTTPSSVSCTAARCDVIE